MNKDMLDKELDLLARLPLEELILKANKVRRDFIGDSLDLCSIINAKSGLCSEDCRFCAQSSMHSTDISVYPLKNKDELLNAAEQAKNIGARRFGIVTSGNRLTYKEIEVIAEALREIKSKIGISLCASLGALRQKELSVLKQAGLSFYHHNIETSEKFYPSIVTTHDFNERLNTIKAAKEAGLKVCSGGIIGMGEGWQDRIDMALTLKELEVDSIPINILVPIKGTAFDSLNIISCVDVIKTIAIFRIILKDKTIKIAAGRENVLKDFQALGFMAGANGMLIGGYLTVKGRPLKEDYRLIAEIKEIWKE